MPLQPGSRVGGYEIIGSLGAGGMGEVYRARDSRLGREVALKVLPEAVASDRDRVARFEREAQVLASVRWRADGRELYYIAPDESQRFLMVVSETAPLPPVTLVLNWAGARR